MVDMNIPVIDPFGVTRDSQMPTLGPALNPVLVRNSFAAVFHDWSVIKKY